MCIPYEDSKTFTVGLSESISPTDLLEAAYPPLVVCSAPEQSDALRRKKNIQLATLCFCLFVVGWNNGTVGPLLPRIQGVYHVGFAVVSLIFVFNAIGFLVASVANVYLSDKLGFGTVMIIGATVQTIGYILDSAASPFPVFVLGYFMSGYGVAILDAGSSGYLTTWRDSTRMGIMQGVYGLGALTAPLSSTQFAQLPQWSFHYLVSLALCVLNITFLSLAFRFRRQDDCLQEIGLTPAPPPALSIQVNKYRQIIRLKEVHLLALFLLLNVGVTSTLGGWIVTYIIDVRNGGPSSGYISSGFYTGVTLSRVLLLWVNKKIGERRVIFIYIVLSLALDLVVWLVPSLIGDAIAIGFIGFLWGPIYPLVMNHAGLILPPWILTGCVTWIIGFGQGGSGFIPFLTGALALKAGIASLQPFVVSLMGFMIIVWFLIPSTPCHVD
ncbi:unnamed protein product [Somion occarium]|uniref:Major facilitator superfamily (MFS) profile domain-containing protein n=1 Tax=Somion occarium TaxID=3059160 RepID=A0ABP1E426_9APHY